MIDGLSRIVRFLVVGGFGAVAFVALAMCLTLIGMQAFLAGAVSYLVLLLPIYFVQHRVTFSSTAQHQRSLPRYGVVQAFGFILSWLLPLLTDETLPRLASFLLVVACVAVFSFVLQTVWVFAQADEKRP